jgi:hypothetical protein
VRRSCQSAYRVASIIVYESLIEVNEIGRLILPLTIIGLRLPMRQIRPMHGMSISTMAMTIGMIRRMKIMFGVLEVESEF